MTINNHFPSRPRRLRRGPLIRDAVANVHLDSSDLIYPLFVTSGKERGTGLGLAIVKQIVDQHRGKVSAKSSAEFGTTFRITIPRNP